MNHKNIKTLNCPKCNSIINIDFFLNLKEAAEFLGFKRSTLRSKVCNEQIPYIGYPHKRRFSVLDIKRWIELGMLDNYTLLNAGMLENITSNGVSIGWRFKNRVYT